MDGKTKYQVIFADNEQKEAISEHLRDIEYRFNEKFVDLARAVDKANLQTRKHLQERDKKLEEWCASEKKRADDNERRQSERVKKVDAEQKRHMKVVEKFLDLIAKRIK